MRWLLALALRAEDRHCGCIGMAVADAVRGCDGVRRLTFNGLAKVLMC